MKQKTLQKLLGMTISFALLFAAGGCSTSSEGISSDGSTSMEKVIGSLGEVWHNEHADQIFTFNPTGSSAGITAVKEGRCDIGLSSRNLTEEEKESGLQGTVLAYDALALIVNPANPLDDLDLETISRLFTGQITNWKELGGNDGQVVLIGREASSGTRDGFESATGTGGCCRYHQELLSSGDIITSVAGNPNAIGYASLASIKKDSVKILKVNGIEPGEESVLSGAYKIQRPFLLVTDQDRPLSECAQMFYSYCLSDAARPVIRQAGVIPAK